MALVRSASRYCLPLRGEGRLRVVQTYFANPPQPTTARSPVRVLICDDHEVVREGLRTLLAGRPEMRVVADEDPAIASLTDQERRVLEHLATGKTNREIGEALFLSEKTIKNYVSRILEKLGLHRRAEAAAFAARRGIQVA